MIPPVHADLAAAARGELELRERAYPAQVADGRMTEAQAESGLAAWRRIVALLEHGHATLDDDADPRLHWAPLVEAAEAALEHRMLKQDEPATAALARIRWLLWRSAFRAGAFDRADPELRREAA